MKRDLEWRIIPDFPRYEINNLGDVRRIVDGFRPVGTLRGKKYWYKLQGDWKYKDIQLAKLMSMAFPELPKE